MTPAEIIAAAITDEGIGLDVIAEELAASAIAALEAEGLVLARYTHDEGCVCRGTGYRLNVNTAIRDVPCGSGRLVELVGKTP